MASFELKLVSPPIRKSETPVIGPKSQNCRHETADPKSPISRSNHSFDGQNSQRELSCQSFNILELERTFMKIIAISLFFLFSIASQVYAQGDANNEGALVIKKDKVDLKDLQSKQSLHDKTKKNKSKKEKPEAAKLIKQDESNKQ